MFSYIYAENRQAFIQYFAASKTENGINRIALDNIKNLADDHSVGRHVAELNPVYDAVKANDVKKAIEAWNHYATVYCKRAVSCHLIQPITFLD